jgi:hypothetical protein
VNITMERIAPPLNRAQTAFLALHAGPTSPHTWQWHFAGSALRATGETGSATIWRDDLEHLIRRGLLRKGVGCADVTITEQGRQAVS